jgi:hypothetical protein
VGCCGQGGCGGEAMHVQEGGVGSKKPRKLSMVTQFRVCRAQWWCGVMTGGCWCRWMAWRWQGGCTFANARAGGQDLGQKPETKCSWLGFGHAA